MIEIFGVSTFGERGPEPTQRLTARQAGEAPHKLVQGCLFSTYPVVETASCGTVSGYEHVVVHLAEHATLSQLGQGPLGRFV